MSKLILSFAVLAMVSSAFASPGLPDQDAAGEGEQTTISANSFSVTSRNHLKVGVSRPDFSELKYQREFYQTPGAFFNLLMSREYGFSDIFSAGFGMQLAYYKKTGRQLKKPSDGEAPDAFRSTGLESSLTLFPYQFFLSGHYSPMGKGSWLSFDVWGGYEELYFHELRMSGTVSVESAALRGARYSELQMADNSSTAQRVINTGWHNGIVLGCSVNFLLNPFDRKSASALRKLMGLEDFYISPFYEVVTDLGSRVYLAGKKSSVVSFARRSAGVAFSFRTST